jgi:hypothetical protein
VASRTGGEAAAVLRTEGELAIASRTGGEAAEVLPTEGELAMASRTGGEAAAAAHEGEAAEASCPAG